MARGSATDLITNVQKPRKPFITKPAIIHLISEIPDPAAYGANDLTRLAEVKANMVWKSQQMKGLEEDQHTANIIYRT
jgi:hypothetical protein